MEAEVSYISNPNFSSLVERLALEANLFVLRYVNYELHYQRFQSGEDGIVCDGVRAVEPLKSFFFKVKEPVARYPAPVSQEMGETRAAVIIGAKACDLRSLEILDRVFIEDGIKDPFYSASRQKTTIISCDCSQPKGTCFCTSLNLNPYPETGFDLNISRLSEGFIVETGSEKGRNIVEENSSLFSLPTDSQIEERGRNRSKTLQEVRGNNEAFSSKKSYRQILNGGLESHIWDRLARECLGCGACTIICPTCHCFLLYDQKENEGFERVKEWDFCYFPGFARVAGRGNPRPRLSDRFKNRYIKKFDFFQENFGIDACTGCGRCIEVCLAEIDIRKVFQELEIT